MTGDELTTVMEDVLDIPDPLAPNAPLDQVEEWDSVNALRLMVYLEHHHDVAVDVEAFLEATSIEDLVRACSPAAAASTGGRHE